jgi:hypothetical protein
MLRHTSAVGALIAAGGAHLERALGASATPTTRPRSPGAASSGTSAGRIPPSVTSLVPPPGRAASGEAVR